MKSKTLLTIAAVSCISSAVANESTGQPSSGFIRDIPFPAQPITRLNPLYPSDAAREGKGGWVKLSLVVDEDGKVGDVVVIDSEGGRGFEIESKKAVKKWKFEPATLNGENVEYCTTIQMDFSLANAGMSAEKIKSALLNVQQALAANDLDAANKGLKRVSEESMPASLQVYYLLFKAEYLRLKNEPEQEYEALKHAANIIEYSRGQIGDIAFQVLFNLFTQQVERQEYMSALITYALAAGLPQASANSLVENMRTYAMQIDSYTGNLQVKLELGKSGNVLHPLFYRTFAFTNASGKIGDIEVRCDKSYQQYSFSTDSQFSIPESWGTCAVLISGSEGAKVEMVEIGS